MKKTTKKLICHKRFTSYTITVLSSTKILWSDIESSKIKDIHGDGGAAQYSLRLHDSVFRWWRHGASTREERAVRPASGKRTTKARRHTDSRDHKIWQLRVLFDQNEMFTEASGKILLNVHLFCQKILTHREEQPVWGRNFPEDIACP